MYAILCIYEKVTCRRVCIVKEILEFFPSIIGVKQGCPFPPTLFGLCIDELENMVLEYMHQEDIKEVMISNVVIRLLLCVDDEVLLTHTIRRCTKAYGCF